MLFVIDNLKYDTDKMELITDKCRYTISVPNILLQVAFSEEVLEVNLWKSTKGRYLLTYKRHGYARYSARGLKEEEVKDLLLTYDLAKYEELFGELEEA